VLGRQLVNIKILAVCDVHDRFAEHMPGPVVATSDGGLVGGESAEKTDDSTGVMWGGSHEGDSLDPRVRKHVAASTAYSVSSSSPT